MEVVLWLSAASKEFSLSRPKSPLNECLTEAPWEMERTWSSVSQLLTATYTWPTHLLEKGWQSNPCAPGAVHGDEEATLLPWPLMVSVMKAEVLLALLNDRPLLTQAGGSQTWEWKSPGGTSPVDQWLWLCAPNLGALGLIPAGN